MVSIGCQTAEYKFLDSELNFTYRKVLAALPHDQQRKLEIAERLWVQFRDADCDVFYGEETGTYASIEAGQCLINRARQRIKELELLLTK